VLRSADARIDEQREYWESVERHECAAPLGILLYAFWRRRSRLTSASVARALHAWGPRQGASAPDRVRL